IHPATTTSTAASVTPANSGSTATVQTTGAVMTSYRQNAQTTDPSLLVPMSADACCLPLPSTLTWVRAAVRGGWLPRGWVRRFSVLGEYEGISWRRGGRPPELPPGYEYQLAMTLPDIQVPGELTKDKQDKQQPQLRPPILSKQP